MKKGLISIIVPVYKVEEYLDRCVESLVNQTYTNLEIILVDDGSPDNSGKLCDEWALKDKRIKVIHKENGGVSSARNIGIDNAKGEYIGFVDSDDYVSLDLYKDVIESFNSDIDFVSWGISSDEEELKIENNNKTLLSQKEMLCSIFPWGGSSCTILFRNVKIQDNKLRFNINYKYGEDLLFVINYLKDVNNGICLSKKYYYYENNFESATRGNNDVGEKYFKSITMSFEILKSSIEDISFDLYKKYILYLFNFCKETKNKENRKIAISLLMENKVYMNFKQRIKLLIYKYINWEIL